MLNQFVTPNQLMFEPTNCIFGCGGCVGASDQLLCEGKLSTDHPPHSRKGQP
jgi:hypothetical protein